ncbi:MAG: AraC family transcriptional regulator [Clostridia bacterium]|nr:AraC family transcriptional regulator [Clostridia bacterium]
MITTVGKLFYQNGKPLIKMWNNTVENNSRPFVRHYHSYFEITLVLSGSGEYTTETEVYPMNPGDIFVFASNEVHYITEIHDDNLSLLILQFEPRFLENIDYSSLKESFLTFCFFHSPDFKNRILGSDSGLIRDKLIAIKQEFENEDAYNHIAIRSHLNMILIDLLRNHNYRCPDVNKSENVVSLLKVYDYIDAHLSEELTLEAISKIAMLSPNYFSHFFKRMNGISLWDYINAKRVEKAEKLITSSKEKLTMLQVATMCGFNNTVNFNKAFKKQKGIAPSELRKLQKQP